MGVNKQNDLIMEATMKQFILTIAIIALTIPAHGHDPKVKELRWANDRGRANTIDWQISDYTIVKTDKTIMIRWRGTIRDGETRKVQATNMSKTRPIRIIFDDELIPIEWKSFRDTYPLMPGETRVWEFMAIRDSTINRVVLRGKMIY